MKAKLIQHWIYASAIVVAVAGCQSTPQNLRQAVDPEPLRTSAQRAYIGGDLVSAEAILQQNIAGHPRDADSWFLLGNIHLRRGHYEAAQGAYQQAALLKPEQGAIWHNLALVHIRLATQTLLKGMEHQADDFEPLLGWLLQVQGADLR